MLLVPHRDADRSANRADIDTEGWRPWALTGGIPREQRVPRFPCSSVLLPRHNLRDLRLKYVRNVVEPVVKSSCPRLAFTEHQSRRWAHVCSRSKVEFDQSHCSLLSRSIRYFSFLRRLISPAGQRWQNSQSAPRWHPRAWWYHAQGLQSCGWRWDPSLAVAARWKTQKACSTPFRTSCFSSF